MKLAKPFRGDYKLTQGFGKAQSGLRYSYHYGLDYGLPNETVLLSAFDGEVEKVVDSFVPMVGYGRHVIIRETEENGATYRILYAHCSKIIVKLGQRVQKGEMIALSGNTGYVVSLGGGGYHLHFGLSKSGTWIDPLPYFLPSVSLPVVSLDTPVPSAPSKASPLADASETYPVPGILTGNFKEYVVKRGDTLWGISLRFYGSGIFWDFLFRNNLDVVGNNPNVLKVGSVLQLPKIKK